MDANDKSLTPHSESQTGSALEVTPVPTGCRDATLQTDGSEHTNEDNFREELRNKEICKQEDSDEAETCEKYSPLMKNPAFRKLVIKQVDILTWIRIKQTSKDIKKLTDLFAPLPNRILEKMIVLVSKLKGLVKYAVPKNNDDPAAHLREYVRVRDHYVKIIPDIEKDENDLYDMYNIYKKSETKCAFIEEKIEKFDKLINESGSCKERFERVVHSMNASIEQLGNIRQNP